jgi:hypothetical protein
MVGSRHATTIGRLWAAASVQPQMTGIGHGMPLVGHLLGRAGAWR